MVELENKNSSILLPKMAANLMRSARGTLFSLARASTLLKNNKLDIVTHMTPSEQIAAITPRVAELQAKCDKYYQHLLSALKENKYIKVDFTTWTSSRSTTGKHISPLKSCPS